MNVMSDTYRLSMRGNGEFDLFNAAGDLAFVSSRGLPMLPHTTLATDWQVCRVSAAEASTGRAYRVDLAPNAAFSAAHIAIHCRAGYVEMYFRGKVRRAHYLNAWQILDAGSTIEAIDVVNFRSHIESPSAYEVGQTILARRRLGSHGLDITTADTDQMFAPHPMMFVFRHLENHLIIAPMGLVAGQLVRLRLQNGATTVDDYRLDIGRNTYRVEAGETLESPHFMITQARTHDVYEMVARYTRLLVRDGYTTLKTGDDLHDWWLAPMWCSWGDQHSYFQHAHGIKWVKTAFTNQLRDKTRNSITEAMVRKVAGLIERHDLPVRTLILDDRWYTRKGDMANDPVKFPRLRGLVDELHRRGFKVMAWASLYRFERDSEVFRRHPEWFIVSPERPDAVHLDYSNPRVANAYLGELMERLLGNHKGGYNFDGLKFDWPFMTPAEFPYADRRWVGKERTIYNTQKLIYTWAKRAKKDALIIGVSPHPFFQDTQDIVRTYDVSTYDPTIHLERARYIKAIAPGMTPAMDEHIFHRNFIRYIREGSQLGIPMIYNIMRFNGDAHVYTTEDYRGLREALAEYVDRTPRLKRYLASVKR